jgi:predicted DsbA family dithiol-disulfide isomerase
MLRPMSGALTIDVVSDVVCPWCFVGKRRLDMALRGETRIEVQYRPFRLDPDLPPEGADRAGYMRAKFGGDEQLANVERALIEAGEEAGIKFAFERISRSPNTLDCHRLIHWAGSAGVQAPVVDALFTLYFEDGIDISLPEVLTDIGVAAGMDRALLRELLAGDEDKDLIISEDELARRMGIQGVPCYILAGRYALIGAQDPQVLKDAFAQARQALAGDGPQAD